MFKEMKRDIIVHLGCQNHTIVKETSIHFHCRGPLFRFYCPCGVCVHLPKLVNQTQFLLCVCFIRKYLMDRKKERTPIGA